MVLSVGKTLVFVAEVGARGGWSRSGRLESPAVDWQRRLAWGRPANQSGRPGAFVIAGLHTDGGNESGSSPIKLAILFFFFSFMQIKYWSGDS